MHQISQRSRFHTPHHAPPTRRLDPLTCAATKFPYFMPCCVVGQDRGTKRAFFRYRHRQFWYDWTPI